MSVQPGQHPGAARPLQHRVAAARPTGISYCSLRVTSPPLVRRAAEVIAEAARAVVKARAGLGGCRDPST